MECSEFAAQFADAAGISLSILKQADGSCEWQMGGTRIICGVNGPADAPQSRRMLDRASLVFSFNNTSNANKLASHGGPSQQLHAMLGKAESSFTLNQALVERVLADAVDTCAYPRMELQLCVQEISADGPTTSSVLNAMFLALLDAGIKLRYSPAALTIALANTQPDPLLYVNPSETEVGKGDTTQFTFVFKQTTAAGENGARPICIASDSIGKFTLNDFSRALECGEKVSSDIFDLYRRVVAKKYTSLLAS